MKNGMFAFVEEELLLAGISKKAINSRKYKELRYDLFYRSLNRFLETEIGLGSKDKTIKYVKDNTGLRVENSRARRDYDRLKQEQPRAKYATKLGLKVKPNKEKIPFTEYSIKGEYLYGFAFFVRIDSKGKKELKKLTKKQKVGFIRLADGDYHEQRQYVFLTNKVLSRADVYKNINKIIFNVGDDNDLDVVGSDYKHIFSDNTVTLVGYRYDRLRRT